MKKLMGGLSIGGIIVLFFAALALLGMMPGEAPFGLGWLVMALIVAGLYAVAVGLVFKGASAGFRRIAKLASILAAVFFLGSAFVLPALQITPGVGPDGFGAPTALLTIAEGSAYDFTDYSTDGNLATGNSEIAVNSDDLIVLLTVTGASAANTLSPDGFAVDFTLRCTASCDYVVDGAAFQTPYHARIIGLSNWVIAGNTTDIEIFEKNTAGTWAIAWTDTGASTIVGFEDGGAMNSFGDGESGTFTFIMYFNENGIPKGIPDGGVKFTRTAIVNIFSPRGGTSFNVTINLVLTNDT